MDEVILEGTRSDSARVYYSVRQSEYHTSQQKSLFSLKVKAYRYLIILDTKSA